MGHSADPDSNRRIEQFINEPTQDLYDWEWLFEGDHQFPLRSHRGILGRLVVLFKKFLRPLVKSPQNDLWDRQRLFNLVVIRHLHDRGPAIDALWRDLKQVRSDLLRDVRTHARRLDHIEGYNRDSFDDVMRYSDGLFALMDQKVDRYRREGEVLWGKLGSVLTQAEQQAGVAGDASESAALPRALPPALPAAWNERNYVELEDRFRGTETDIAGRAEPYIDVLKNGPSGVVLDLGCGRGETLQVLTENGIACRGVDLSRAMVEHTQEKGLDAEEKDLFSALEEAEEGSLAGIISLHVIEHLPGEALDRLVRLAWSRLMPGGRLILETPNPESVVVAARNFWLDPTHLRPVHPRTLQLVFEQAGFKDVEKISLRPFSEEDRLPEIDVTDLDDKLLVVVDQINQLRDRLDGLLYGDQDYAVVGTRP